MYTQGWHFIKVIFCAFRCSTRPCSSNGTSSTILIIQINRKFQRMQMKKVIFYAKKRSMHVFMQNWQGLTRLETSVWAIFATLKLELDPVQLVFIVAPLMKSYVQQSGNSVRNLMHPSGRYELLLWCRISMSKIFRTTNFYIILQGHNYYNRGVRAESASKGAEIYLLDSWKVVLICKFSEKFMLNSRKSNFTKTTSLRMSSIKAGMYVSV